MSRPLDRMAAAALVCLAVLPIARRAAAEQPPAEQLVLAVFAFAQESYWRRTAIDLAERFGAESLYAWEMESLEEECVVFRLPQGRDTKPLPDALRADPRVALAAPVQRFRTLGEPAWNDTYSALQRGLESLGLESAQRVATGRGVKIAVVDTGVDFSHPELVGRVTEARSFVERGEESFTSDTHGTAIAGVIAAAANNGIGIVGVAPRSELAALKACWPDPPRSRHSTCDTYTLARALDHAVLSGARILNLSLAGPEDALLGRLLSRAEEAGLLVVAAADEAGGAPFPASHPSVLAVRSENPDAAGIVAGDGASVLLLAPGVDILSTGPGATYDFFSGSSFAAAHVSGVAALVLEKRPGLSPAELRSILISPAAGTARPAHLSACAALSRATGREVCAATEPVAPTGASEPRDPSESGLERDPL